jgi:hypothetical protein
MVGIEHAGIVVADWVTPEIPNTASRDLVQFAVIAAVGPSIVAFLTRKAGMLLTCTPHPMHSTEYHHTQRWPVR